MRDREGRLVPTASDRVDFAVSGPLRIIGVGNGDPGSHEADKANERKLFNGLAQVIVQTSYQAGPIVLRAKSEGLSEASVELMSSAAGASAVARVK